MLWDKVKNFFKRKQGTTVVAAALASQVAYGQTEPKTEDKKQDKTEKVVIQQVSFENGMSEAINDNPISGISYQNVDELYAMYLDFQKELQKKDFTVETDTISFDEFVKSFAGGFFNHNTNSVHRYFVKVENPEQVSSFIQKKLPDLSEEEHKSRAKTLLNLLKQQNDSSSLDVKSIIAHEAQHWIVNKKNIQAPGLSVAQFGVIEQTDELAARFASVLLIDKAYQDKINQGMPAREALKVFDEYQLDDISFYKDLYSQKEKLGTDKFQALLWKRTRQEWIASCQEIYAPSIKANMKVFCKRYDIGSLAFGNDKEFQSRINKLLKSVNDNPVLKKAGVKVGDFSKYLNDEDKFVPLSPELQKAADALTLYYTGMTPEFAKKLSDEMPGDQKEDAINLVKVFSEMPVSKEIADKFDYRIGDEYEIKDISKTYKDEDPLEAAQRAFIQSKKLSR